MTETKTLPASALILSILEGALTKEWELVKTLPDGTRARVKYRMQVLRAEENMAALKAAQEFAKSKGEAEGYGDLYKEAQVHELLQRAMRHAEKHERGDGTSLYLPVFTSADQLRAALTESDCAALLNAYQITKSEFGNIEGLDEEDAETWIARLSDPLRGPFFLSQCDSLHWPGLVLLLAKVCRALYEDLGRPLPSSEPSSESGPANSTGPTGSSGPPAQASSTDGRYEVPGDVVLTKEQAAELVEKAKNKKPEA